jgi:hypothetical protein
MTPDEVVNVLKEIKEYGLDPDCFSNADKQQALSTAISLLQDYQKLRERVSKPKILVDLILCENIYNPDLTISVNPEQLADKIVTYLQQPTEH